MLLSKHRIPGILVDILIVWNGVQEDRIGKARYGRAADPRTSVNAWLYVCGMWGHVRKSWNHGYPPLSQLVENIYQIPGNPVFREQHPMLASWDDMSSGSK